MIPKPSKEKFTFIFHRENAAPKYFEIDRRRLINYFIAIPIGFISLFAVLFVLTLIFRGESDFHIPKTIAPPTTTKANSEDLQKVLKDKEELQGKLQELQSANQELVTKLSTNSGKTNPPLQELALFTILPDQKDTSSTPLMAINELKITEEGEELNFHANLLNTKGESSKVSGHLFIIMKAENAVWIYPTDAFPKDKTTINYNSGETVLFARLRLVDAKFPLPPKGSKTLFKVLLFSRTGDLIYKEVFPYEVK